MLSRSFSPRRLVLPAALAALLGSPIASMPLLAENTVSLWGGISSGPNCAAQASEIGGLFSKGGFAFGGSAQIAGADGLNRCQVENESRAQHVTTGRYYGLFGPSLGQFEEQGVRIAPIAAIGRVRAERRSSVPGSAPFMDTRADYGGGLLASIRLKGRWGLAVTGRYTRHGRAAFGLGFTFRLGESRKF